MPTPLRTLRVLADAAIPLADKAFGRFGLVRCMPGPAITRADAAHADVLLVRSVTPVNEALLTGTPVRFVGTATAGTDHVDEAWLRAAGIGFASAPGSNAESVVEYVLAALLALAAARGEGLCGKTLGVVGAGEVGGRLVLRAEALGLRVLASDAPLAEAAEAQGRPHAFAPLEQVVAESDVLTLHVPLVRTGRHATHHLVGAAALAAMKPGAWLLNTARGGVVDDAALRAALDAGRPGAAVLDVWEGEPLPDVALARQVALATPHVAGYSFDGKLEGTRMLERALREWLRTQGAPLPPLWDGEEASPDESPLVAEAPFVPAAFTPAAEALFLDALARQAYSLRADDARFRTAVLEAPPEERAAAFHRLRRDYPRRRAWTRFAVRGAVPEGLQRAVTQGLGMRLEGGG